MLRHRRKPERKTTGHSTDCFLAETRNIWHLRDGLPSFSSTHDCIQVTNEIITTDLPQSALQELRWARDVLQHRGIADRLTELVGTPITASLKLLPDVTEDLLYRVIDRSLKAALDVAVRTLGQSDGDVSNPSLRTHKLLAGISGAAGGVLGGATVAAELPVSTVLILRSVADIARSEGEDLSDLETRLACLEVFALDPGKGSDIDDQTEIGYFAVRAAMAKQIKDATQYIAKNGLGGSVAPPLVKLISQIGKRFGLVVSEKIAAQAVPVIGAIGGALINSYFIDHYQDLARAHFAIRRLERQHGADLIRRAYESLPRENK
ncbi:EcsC protein family protein [Crateriforma conspicua]|uniref:EcsC protein family protein n=1 Tax=Crateriforma conspicua TaxID=2527996 RepID=A0A5C5Y2N8_9PLAN|nr:EcsC protein family protein [Crateriforma conspicua]